MSQAETAASPTAHTSVATPVTTAQASGAFATPSRAKTRRKAMRSDLGSAFIAILPSGSSRRFQPLRLLPGLGFFLGRRFSLRRRSPHRPPQ